MRVGAGRGGVVRVLSGAVVVAACGLAGWGQEGRARAVGEMVDVAMGAGPEAGADVLLGLLEKGRIGDAKLRRRVLEDVWAMAGRVGDGYPRTGVTPAYSERTEAGRQLMLSELGVDGLSIRSRVLRLMALTAEARAEVVGLQAKGVRIPGVNAVAAGALERAMAESRDPVIALYGRMGREFGERRTGWR